MRPRSDDGGMLPFLTRAGRGWACAVRLGWDCSVRAVCAHIRFPPVRVSRKSQARTRRNCTCLLCTQGRARRGRGRESGAPAPLDPGRKWLEFATRGSSSHDRFLAPRLFFCVGGAGRVRREQSGPGDSDMPGIVGGRQQSTARSRCVTLEVRSQRTRRRQRAGYTAAAEGAIRVADPRGDVGWEGACGGSGAKVEELEALQPGLVEGGHVFDVPRTHKAAER
jgi:hypothetical protein